MGRSGTDQGTLGKVRDGLEVPPEGLGRIK